VRTKEHAVTTVHSCMCTKVHCTGCTCSVHAQLKEINFIYHLEGTCTIYIIYTVSDFLLLLDFYSTFILLHLQLYVYFLLLLISATGTSTATFYPIVYPHPSCTVDLVPTVLQQYFYNWFTFDGSIS